MSSDEKKEQRRDQRVIANVPVTVKKGQNGSTEELTGHTRDLSQRGVFMYLSHRVSEGSELELVFPVPQGDSPVKDMWVRCKARVLRVEKTDGGTRFGVAAVLESYERLEDTVANA
ncbi:MAG TPA: PilZ domain-containing protein [Terriglobales bacterium]|nr:PilZ domain-containing protein [Terriglobales bacterium]